VTVIGYPAYERVVKKGQAYVPAFSATDRDATVRFGVRIALKSLYIAVSYLGRSFDYLGYPAQHGVGFGIDKLPDLDRPLSIYGSVHYYPSIAGRYAGPTSTLLGSLSGATFDWSYRVVRDELGAAYVFKRTPFFIEAGAFGDRGSGKVNAPADFQHDSFLVGAGLHI
jgi:hypothetical protein